MALQSTALRLKFHYHDIGKTIIDKKLGLKICLGLMSKMRTSFSEYEQMNKGFCICFQEQGMPQNELDHLCDNLIQQAKAQGIDILVTKNDLPFDNRWYIIGALRDTIEAARIGKITLPFSNFILTNMLIELEEYED